MSSNIDLTALIERNCQRFTRLSASAGERLFSPQSRGVSFSSPLCAPGPRDSAHGGGVGGSGESVTSSGVSGGC